MTVRISNQENSCTHAARYNQYLSSNMHCIVTYVISIYSQLSQISSEKYFFKFWTPNIRTLFITGARM